MNGSIFGKSEIREKNYETLTREVFCQSEAIKSLFSNKKSISSSYLPQYLEKIQELNTKLSTIKGEINFVLRFQDNIKENIEGTEANIKAIIPEIQRLIKKEEERIDCLLGNYGKDQNPEYEVDNIKSYQQDKIKQIRQRIELYQNTINLLLK